MPAGAAGGNIAHTHTLVRSQGIHARTQAGACTPTRAHTIKCFEVWPHASRMSQAVPRMDQPFRALGRAVADLVAFGFIFTIVFGYSYGSTVCVCAAAHRHRRPTPAAAKAVSNSWRR